MEDTQIDMNTKFESNLDSRYNFKNFRNLDGITDKALEHAHSVAEQPGNIENEMNPLFIHGDSSSGKTHLLHAIGNYIVKDSNKKVLYITGNEFNKDVNKLDTESLKQKYTNIDVLLFDDLQDILHGTIKTQQELFNIFKDLCLNDKQIVVTSNIQFYELPPMEGIKYILCWGNSSTLSDFQDDEDKSIIIESNLNPKYTFDNFLKGICNESVKQYALMVAERPGSINLHLNPLFIHGDSGSGKTHLLNAMGNYIIKDSNKKVLYITGNEFNKDVNELDDESLKQKYTNIDVLLFDDLQDIAHEFNKTQLELFNIIINLLLADKQVVVASKVWWGDLAMLGKPFKYIFEGHPSLYLFPPDPELIEKLSKI